MKIFLLALIIPINSYGIEPCKCSAKPTKVECQGKCLGKPNEYVPINRKKPVKPIDIPGVISQIELRKKSLKENETRTISQEPIEEESLALEKRVKELERLVKESVAAIREYDVSFTQLQEYEKQKEARLKAQEAENRAKDRIDIRKLKEENTHDKGEIKCGNL